MNNFRVGMKVVCVDDAPRPRWWPTQERPRYGRVYTVCAIVEYKGAPCLGLTEVDFGWPFYADRFRPAVEKPCDISVFQKMLSPDKEVVS